MRKIVAFSASLVLGIAVCAAVTGARQQDKSKRPSPPASAHCSLPDGKTIHTDYSSPRMKGRKVFAADGLVPFGKPWRAGANEATTFVTTANLEAGGKEIPAGSYTLFTVPNAGEWTLIISKKTGEWGIPYPGEQYDFARIPMQVSSLSSPMEDFTITYTKSGGGCTLNMEWENTGASVTFTEK
ncbi:MAG TPA: DUF2911 domain-containing protein [Candidatus Acidoferrales bacterium]|nr:DUF2911 domain-containing protein [Candidatus Acidoferrales bacterium]